MLSTSALLLIILVLGLSPFLVDFVYGDGSGSSDDESTSIQKMIKLENDFNDMSDHSWPDAIAMEKAGKLENFCTELLLGATRQDVPDLENAEIEKEGVTVTFKHTNHTKKVVPIAISCTYEVYIGVGFSRIPILAIKSAQKKDNHICYYEMTKDASSGDIYIARERCVEKPKI